jgi:hypothetical protein
MRISSISTLAGAGLITVSLVACGGAPGGDARAKGGAPPDSAAAGDSAGVRPAAAPMPADTGSRMDRVAGFAWGATREQIVARRGPPQVERADFEGVKALGYPETLMGEPVVLIYFVHPERGLFRGAYGLQLTSVEQCERVLTQFESGLARRFAAIEPARLGEYQEGRCQSYTSGGPGFLETWREPESGARVALGLARGAGSVALVHSTPDADEWERRRAASQP